jgi:hypothetical protein
MACPVIATAIVPGRQDLVIVLVVDDSGDDELTAAMASQKDVPSERWRGAWKGEVRLLGDDNGDTATFVLLDQETEREREWAMENWDLSVLEAAASGDHYVALLPVELAGGLAQLNPKVLMGALIVLTSNGAPGLASILAVRAASR